MPDQSLEPALLHQFKNHLSIIVGYCDLILGELPEGDPRHADLLEVQKAARAALALIPELSNRLH